MITYNSNKMAATRRGFGFVEGTSDEATQNPMVHDVPGDVGDAQKSKIHRRYRDQKKISRE